MAKDRYLIHMYIADFLLYFSFFFYLIIHMYNILEKQLVGKPPNIPDNSK